MDTVKSILRKLYVYCFMCLFIVFCCVIVALEKEDFLQRPRLIFSMFQCWGRFGGPNKVALDSSEWICGGFCVGSDLLPSKNVPNVSLQACWCCWAIDLLIKFTILYKTKVLRNEHLAHVIPASLDTGTFSCSLSSMTVLFAFCFFCLQLRSDIPLAHASWLARTITNWPLYVLKSSFHSSVELVR